MERIRMCLMALMVIMTVPAICRAQQTISTPCTTSMITSFTPCLNFVTGSSSNGASPTASCCSAFKDVVAASMDCACLLLTANVPIQLPFGRPAISLPRACKMSVPLRCKASGSPLPAPGPTILGPSAPPGPSSPQAAAGVADVPAPDSTVTLPLSPAISPEADNPTGGARPVVNTSASVSSHDVAPAASLLIAMAILLMTYYYCF